MLYCGYPEIGFSQPPEPLKARQHPERIGSVAFPLGGRFRWIFPIFGPKNQYAPEFLAFFERARIHRGAFPPAYV